MTVFSRSMRVICRYTVSGDEYFGFFALGTAFLVTFGFAYRWHEFVFGRSRRLYSRLCARNGRLYLDRIRRVVVEALGVAVEVAHVHYKRYVVALCQKFAVFSRIGKYRYFDEYAVLT